MSIIERKPSFFKVGGLKLIDEQRLTAGRNMDGSFYIDIKGRTHARAILTPKQTEQLADGLLNALGLTYDNARTNGKGI